MNERVELLRKTVGTLTEVLTNRGLKVTQAGTKAFTRSNAKGEVLSINLPFLPDSASDELCEAVQGYLDHEVAHVLFSDFKLMHDVIHEGGAKNDRLHSVINVVEDARIEKEMAKKFTGSGANLTGVGSFMLDKVITPAFNKAMAEGKMDAAAQWLMVPLLRQMAGQLLFEQFMRDKMPIVQPIYDRIKSLEPELRSMTSTADACAIAGKILKALKDESSEGGKGSSESSSKKGKGEKSDKPSPGKPQKGKPEDGEGESKGTPKPNDGESESGKSKDSKPKSKPKPKPNEEEQEPDEKEGEGEDQGTDADEDAEAEKPKPEKESEGESEKESKPEEGEGSEEESEGEAESGESPESEPEEGEGSESKADEEEEAESESGAEEEEAEKDESEASGGGASGSEEEEEGEDEGAGAGDDEGDDGEEEAEISSSMEEAGEGDSEEHGFGGALSFDPIDKEKAQGLEDVISGVITKAAAEAMAKAPYRIYTTEHDVIELLHVGSGYDDSMIKAVEDPVANMVNVIQKDLERAISARSLAVWENGTRTGRLHSGGLAKLVVRNDPRVFRRKHESHSKDVAVCLLDDCSGSMSGQKVLMAAQASFALSQTLERLQIKHEVLGFTTGSTDERTYREMLEDQRTSGIQYTRIESLYMPIIKAFNERLTTDVRKRFGWLPHMDTMRSNVDGECVRIAARRLLARREAGKVLMVLSDGMPASASPDSGAVTQDLKDAVIEVEKAGIKVIGIGIMSNAVERFYRKRVLVNNINDLPTTVIKELRGMLLAN